MDAFVFSSPIHQCLPAKLPPFLTTVYVGRYGPVVKDFDYKVNGNIALAVPTF